MFRLAKEHGYQHVEDFLDDHENSAELTGLIAYERMEDEIQTNRLIHAFSTVLYAGQKTRKAQAVEEDEEIIDTTKPEFAEKFKGFTNMPQQRVAPSRQQMNNTQILMG